MNTTNAAAAPPEEIYPGDPLWPKNQRIEIIGLTGEFASGKTLFALTIDPKRTLIYDAEKSAGSYQSLGFERVDMSAVMLKHNPHGYKPKDLFLRWRESVRNLKPGQYRVIVLDPVSEIESGLCDWVRDNPQEFGHTDSQYQKMESLFWGDVKDHWKMILNDLSGRCEVFCFTSHMRNVWTKSGPTGKRQAKGKETLMELASLYLQLERKPDAKGNVPAAPAAIVLKSRLASTRLNEKTGEVEIVPTLPPRLPVATPTAIRAYMLAPPDYGKLKKAELAPEQVMSADEKLQMETAKAEAERDAEAMRLDRMNKMQQLQAKHQNGAKATPATAPSLNGVNGLATEAQLTELMNLKGELLKLGLTQDQWVAAVQKRGADKAVNLPKDKAAELINALSHRLNCLLMERDIDKKSGTRQELAGANA